MQLSTKLRAFRKERPYTLAKVSEKTGISISFLSDIERGQTYPSLRTLAKLAEFYQVTVSNLLAGVDIE